MDMITTILELLLRLSFGGAMGLLVAWYVSRKTDDSYKFLLNAFSENTQVKIELLARVDDIESEIKSIQKRLNVLEDK